MQNGHLKHKWCDALIALYWKDGKLLFFCTECMENWSASIMGIKADFVLSDDMEIYDEQ